MPKKTLKQRRNRQRTLRRLRRVRRKGGADRQALEIPSSAFGPKIGAPLNSADPFYFK